jgi:hypothetical protein
VGDITVNGIRWEPMAAGEQASSGNLILNEDEQYELVLDDEGNGLATVGLGSGGSGPPVRNSPNGW